MSTPCPCQRPGVKPTSAYALGCRHPASLTAVRNYRKRWRAGLHQPGWIDSTGTRRRLEALAAIGWSANALADHTGLSYRWLRELRAGKTDRITRKTRDRVTAIYNQLWDTPGPCPWARGHATRHGWAVPMAWDDDTIDDPTAQPDLGRPARGRIDPADITHLESFGHTRHQIAERLAVDPESITTALRRKAS